MADVTIHSRQTGRDYRAFHEAMRSYTFDSMADYENLRKVGIGVSAQDIAKLHNMYSYALDSNYVAPQSTPSITTPIQFLQAWAPGFVNKVTWPRMIDVAVGMATIGSWRDEEVVQGYNELSGNVQTYNDNTNAPLAGFNVNFERRTIVRFELAMQVGSLEIERASAMNYDSIGAKRTAVMENLDIIRNYTGFYGFNGGLGRTYGLLNDPSLPAYSVFPNGALASPLWQNKTATEIQSDILLMIYNLNTQSGGRADVETMRSTLLLPVNVKTYLARGTTSFTTSTVKEWLRENYPLMRIEYCPEFENAYLSSNVAYLYIDETNDASTDDMQVIDQFVPAKVFLVGTQQLVKGFQEDYSNATAGVMVKRPWGITRNYGC